MLLLKLFFAFIQVGMFSVGGGYAAIPLIQEQIVNIYGLMSMEEFSDLITVAEMTPGPISINSATLLGMRLAVEHNLYFYNTFMEKIRDAIDEGTFAQFREHYSPLLASKLC